jgi:hypothetical protein
MTTSTKALATLTLLAMSVTGHPAAAQDVEVGGWLAASRSSEITTGLTLCNARGCFPSSSSPTGSAARNSVHGAVMARAPLSPRLAIRAELAVAPKGYTPPTHPYVTSTYLEAPVLAEVAFLRLGSVSLTAAAGLAPALLVSCSVAAETVNGFKRTGCQEDWAFAGETEPRFLGPRSLDLGAAVAFGARFPFPRGTGFLELRHTLGLIDSNPDQDGTTRNLTYALAAGYTVPLRRTRVGSPG